MKYIENVTGSEIASAPLIMNVDTIYVHTNIRKAVPKEGEEDRNEYQYTERQYTYEEYKEKHAEIAQLLADDANDQYTLSLMESGVL
nr:MAG TPA: hypothetical protein [Caudoviricetes sp.]